jgi:serine protease Do
MEMKNQLKSYVVIALLSSGVTLGAYQLLNLGNQTNFSDSPSAFSSNVSNISAAGAPGEFTYAAEKSTPAVVHIKTKMEQRQRQYLSLIHI